jgi:hypothetical protein
MSSRPNLKELPEWVTVMDLPKVAIDGIDRYSKPVWDEGKDELELPPDDRARPADPGRRRRRLAFREETHTQSFTEGQRAA